MRYDVVIVGADRANSRVARALGLPRPGKVMNAVEAEVYLGDSERLGAFKHSAHFRFGLIPQGYVWVFPKRDHLSIGVLSRSMTMKRLRGQLVSFLETEGFSPSIDIRVLRYHLIPYGPGKERPLACPASDGSGLRQDDLQRSLPKTTSLQQGSEDASGLFKIAYSVLSTSQNAPP